jgi:putative nucleotidyltransferase with HDIG domain
MTDLDVSRYEPRSDMFLAPGGLHGLAHAARVLVLAEMIADRRSDCDLEVVRWAAAYHDVGRVDDSVDPDHGMRSAGLFLRYARTPLEPTRHGLVAYAMTWHAPEDDQVPAWTPELRVLKDADALDRVRLGDFDSGYLRTSEAAQLIEYAEALYRQAPQAASWREVEWAARRLSAIRSARSSRR